MQHLKIGGIESATFRSSSSCSLSALPEANNNATEASVGGSSGQRVSHGEDCPSTVESAPSRAETYGAQSEARDVNVIRSFDAFGIRQRSKRGGHDGRAVKTLSVMGVFLFSLVRQEAKTKTIKEDARCATEDAGMRRRCRL